MDNGNLLLIALLLIVIFVFVAIASGVDLFKEENVGGKWIDKNNLAGFNVPSNALKRLDDFKKIRPLDKVVEAASKWAKECLPRPYPENGSKIVEHIRPAINQVIVENRPAQDQVHRRALSQKRRDVDRYADPLAKPWIPAHSHVQTEKVLVKEQNIIPVVLEAAQVLDSSDEMFEVNFAEIHLNRLIGSGGFGAVWSGVWRGTDVAVKMIALPPSRNNQDNNSLMRAFQQELKMISSLRHPNICLFMGACIDPDHLVIMTELLSNGSLWEVIRNSSLCTRDGPGGCGLPWPMIRKILMGTARGMNYLHLQSPPVLHRDLKSPNLLLDESMNIKICDFGLARTRECTGAGNMTKYCGTVQWMSPEVMEGLPYTESADVYAFGIVIWEILTRQCPFEGENQVQIALRVCRMKERPVMPEYLSSIIKRTIESCWSQASKDRPTFSDLVKTIIPSLFE